MDDKRLQVEKKENGGKEICAGTKDVEGRGREKEETKTKETTLAPRTVGLLRTAHVICRCNHIYCVHFGHGSFIRLVKANTAHLICLMDSGNKSELQVEAVKHYFQVNEA